MKTIVAAALAALIAAPAAAQLAPSLPTVFAKTQQALKAAPKGRHFELTWERGGWRFLLNPNPPGSGLLLDLYEGEHVRLLLTNEDFRGEPGIFDIDAVNVHAYLLNAGDQANFEFDAPKQGIYFIQAGAGIIGRMIVHKP